MSDLSDRLDNWARCWRRKLEIARTPSIEGAWRSPQEWNALGAPQPSQHYDPLDAIEVESAVCCIDIYHHVVLKGHYVRQWAPAKCLHAARKAAGDRNLRRKGDFVASLAMAHALISGALELPAAIRKDRTRTLVAAALAIPQTLDSKESSYL